MADKPLKKWSVSLIIRKVPVKITMRYRFISVKMAAIFFKKKLLHGEDVEKLESLCIAVGNIK